MKDYKRAEAMLEPTPFPSTLSLPRKFEVLQDQAAAVGLATSCYLVPQTTTFESRINAAGVKMQASSLSGQESMGCNDGSKSSTLVTYLADAWSSGADMFCDCDVRYVKKHPVEGYLVFFREEGRSQLSWVHARKFVFLGAGALGSTEIALRSREHGLGLSSSAGRSISSNGSMLAFGYGLNQRVNAIGTPHLSTDPPGPTISGTIDCRDSSKLEHRFMIQDGAFPTIMAVFFRMVRILLPKLPRGAETWRKMFWTRGRAVLRRDDALQRTQCYLVLGHDNSGGVLSLEKGMPSLDLHNMQHTGKPGYIKNILVAMSHALNGTFVEPLFGVVVHPMGGLSLSSDGTGKCGATIHTGEVLSGESTNVHQGLIVLDGALIPRSLGSNPLATISALAERAVHLAAERSGLSVDLSVKRRFEATEHQQSQGQGESRIEFSEIMQGNLVTGTSRTPLELSMTITISETQNGFAGDVAGTARCIALSKDLMIIKRGEFKLFELDPSAPMQRKMVYDLCLIDSAGEELRLDGTKTINISIGLSPFKAWRATTTLATTVSTSDASVLGKAELHISLAGFLEQLRSLRVLGSNAQSNREVLLRFVLNFAARMYEVMLTPFATGLQYPEDLPSSGPDPSSKPQPSSLQKVVAQDGVESTLRVWQPSCVEKGAAIRNLLFIPGGAVTHEIFALPTIKTNAIDYFIARGYRCWCITHRAATIDRSKDKRSWTTLDARLDVKAALEAIRERQGEL